MALRVTVYMWCWFLLNQETVSDDEFTEALPDIEQLERLADDSDDDDLLLVSCQGLCFLVKVQWSLYFKTTHGTKKTWSYIAGGLKIKVI